jgi:capsular polysaccharide biosynthesis protein
VTLAGATLYSFFVQSAHYRARVLLLAQPQKYTWRLDVNFQTIAEDLRVDRRSDYAILITEEAPGQKLAQRVLDKLGDALPADLRSSKAVWRSMTVKNGTGRLMTLDASAATAELAKVLANTWAAVWIDEVDARYGQSGDKARFEAALAQARETLAVAMKARQDFQARTGLGLELGNQMTTLQEGTMAAGLTARQQELVLKSSTLAEYQVALDRVRVLKAQAEAAKAGSRAMNSLPLEVLDTPLLVQRGQLTRQQVANMNGNLTLLVQALADEEQALADTVKDLKNETDGLQSELAAWIEERNLLNRQYAESEEAVRALERKVTEITIQQGVVGPPLALLSPADTATPTWIINLVLAGVVGILVGTLLALALRPRVLG